MVELNFKRSSIYTRESIGEICYPGVGRPKGGDWDTGYVRVEAYNQDKFVYPPGENNLPI